MGAVEKARERGEATRSGWAGLESCGRGRVAGVPVWLVSSRAERSEAAVRPGVQDSDTERPRDRETDGERLID